MGGNRVQAYRSLIVVKHQSFGTSLREELAVIIQLANLHAIRYHIIITVVVVIVVGRGAAAAIVRDECMFS